MSSDHDSLSAFALLLPGIRRAATLASRLSNEAKIAWYCSAAHQKDAWSEQKGPYKKTKKERQQGEDRRSHKENVVAGSSSSIEEDLERDLELAL